VTGFTDRTSQGILGHIVGKTALYTLPTAYLALFTGVGGDAVSGDAGTGFTEVTGGAYARLATAGADWTAPSGSAPSTIRNANAFTFPTATASWGALIAFGLYDAGAGGNLLAWDFLGAYPWLPATVSAATPAVITAKAHGFAAADLLAWTNEYGGTVPGFSQSNFTGPLAVTSPATDTFRVTNGGTAVNTATTGSGMVRKLGSQSVAAGNIVSFPIGSIILSSS
jgi:hypothetical protein